MNVKMMRRVDRWAGVPACALLSGVRKIGRLFGGRPSPEPNSVLFLKLAEQGSTVLAYPALQAAVDRFGRENVYFLVFEENRFVLDVMDVLPRENVIAIPCRGAVATLWNVLIGILQVRKKKIDAAIDLEFFARATAVLSFLSGARQRVGLHAFAGDGPYRGDLMTHRVHYNPHLHTSQAFLLQVQALEQPAGAFPTFDQVPVPLDRLPLGSFRPDADEIANVKAKMVEWAGGHQVPRLVLLNANCSDLLPLRRWDEDKFVELARQFLDDDPDLWVGFTGAPDEAGPVEALVARVASPRCISLAGRTTLRELLVVYGLSELLVTNDSGPAHFATLTDVSVICLFGPETPELFGSLSPRSHVLWARTACSPCVSAYNNRVSSCQDNVCMQRISVQAVFDKGREVLASRSVTGETDDAWEIPARERTVAAAPGAGAPGAGAPVAAAPGAGAPGAGAPGATGEAAGRLEPEASALGDLPASSKGAEPRH